MNRWILEMRDFQYKIEYKPGRKNVVADQLSRPVRVLRDERWLGKTKDELVELQRAEPRWNEMIEYLEGVRIPRAWYPRATLDQFTLEDQILCLCKQNHIHDREAGHLGQHKTILKARAGQALSKFRPARVLPLFRIIPFRSRSSAHF